MESSHDRKAGNEENGQVPSFNSVTQHYQTIMGAPTQKVDMSKIPRPLRFFGYFAFTVMAACLVLFLTILLVQNFIR